MRWILILEEYRPELINIQGSRNIAADVLSRLDIVDTPNAARNNMKSMNEHYGLEDEDFHTLLIIEQSYKINTKIKYW